MNRIEVIYADNILAEHLGSLGEHVAVVDEVAWGLCGDELSTRPAHVVVPGSLERDELDRIAAFLPRHVPVVGIGGGMVIDAAKYVALRADALAVLVPSITSSNAPFTDAIALRHDGEPVGMVAAGQPKRVLVDFSLIARADPRFNRAGYADLLAHEIALRDWRLAARAGRGAMDDKTYSLVAEIMAECREMAHHVGSGDRAGIEFVMRAFERMARLLAAYPNAPIGAGSEHLVAWNIEAVTGRHFLHGELVALGIVVADLAGDDRWVRQALDQACVCYRLDELGLTWPEVEEALLTLDDYNRRARGFDRGLVGLDWSPELLDRVRAVLEAQR